jgi:CIC family chloride channel protein
MEDVMETFDKTDAQMLPVVDLDGRLIGYISRSYLYTEYRQMVADMSAD